MFRVCLALAAACCIAQVVYAAIPAGTVTYAVNAGGDAYRSPDGVVYEADRGFSDGVASDYGLKFDIARTEEDAVYGTERYHLDSFSYQVPIKEDGEYVLTLKFSEVWFNAPYQKVFDVEIGGVRVVQELDIFANVGRAVAHDEYIPIVVKGRKLTIEGQDASSGYDVSTRTMVVEFVKLSHDNPKVCGLVLTKGTLQDVKRLPPYLPERELEDDEIPQADDFEEEELEVDPAFREPVKRHRNVEEPDFPEESQGIMSLLFSATGLAIIGTLGLFVGLVRVLNTTEDKKKKKSK